MQKHGLKINRPNPSLAVATDMKVSDQKPGQLITVFRFLATTTLMFLLLTSFASAARPLYDSFDEEYLDTIKWRPGSFSTNIQSGYFEIRNGDLNMGMRTYADLGGKLGSTDEAYSNLWISKAASNKAVEIQTTLRVRTLKADRCPNSAAAKSYAEVHLRAFWFNDGTSKPRSSLGVGVGDVYTNLSISQRSVAGDPIILFANVFRVTESGVDFLYSNRLGTLNRTTRPITLRTTWDPVRKQFRFYKNVPLEGKKTLVYNYADDVKSKSRPAWSFNGKGLTLRTFPAYCGNRLIYTEANAVVEEFRVR